MPIILEQTVNEKSSCMVSFTLRNYPDPGALPDSGDPITRSNVSTMTMTLFDKDTEATINVYTNSLTAFADAGGGDVTCTSAGVHSLAVGDVVAITDTTNYDGTYTVQAVPLTTTFTITHSDDGDDATGTWTRTKTNVLSSLNVSDGTFLHELVSADNPIVDSERSSETHIALFEIAATVGGNTITLNEEAHIKVLSLVKIT